MVGGSGLIPEKFDILYLFLTPILGSPGILPRGLYPRPPLPPLSGFRADLQPPHWGLKRSLLPGSADFHVLWTGMARAPGGGAPSTPELLLDPTPSVLLRIKTTTTSAIFFQIRSPWFCPSPFPPSIPGIPGGPHPGGCGDPRGRGSGHLRPGPQRRGPRRGGEGGARPPSLGAMSPP